MARSNSVSDLIIDYFRQHPDEDMAHGPVVDWVEEQYVKIHGIKPRDPWRAIRKLHQEGMLVKVKKGIYRYDPDRIKQMELLDFPANVKEQIFKRDGYRCVVCGRGPADGVEICCDHIKPKDKGGDNSLANGQTLCSEHNLMKKNYSQTEAGKRYCIRMYEQAVANGDKRVMKFCQDVFDVYDKHGINGHIRRPNGR